MASSIFPKLEAAGNQGGLKTINSVSFFNSPKRFASLNSILRDSFVSPIDSFRPAIAFGLVSVPKTF